MKRINVVSWVDCKVLTKKCCALLEQLGEYAHRGYEKDGIYGDSNLIIALIDIETTIGKLRDKSKQANQK